MMYVKWYLLLLELKRWHRYAITLLGLTIILIVWLITFYLPLHKQIMIVHMQLHQRTQDVQTSIAEQQLCKKLSQEVEQLQSVADKDLVSPKNSLEQNIALIAGLLETHGLRLSSLRKEGIIKDETNSTALILIETKGSLQSIYEFFSTLQKNQYLVQCSSFAIEHERDGLYALQATLKFLISKKDKKERK